MSFALLQTGLDKLPPGALERAFKVLRELVDIDADTLSADGHGILASGLGCEHADALHDALKREGLDTEVVDASRLIGLPSPRQTRRLDCLKECLLVHDALGRPTPVPWERVVLVAAGFVTLSEFERKERTRVVVRGGGGQLPSYPIVLTDVAVREHSRARLVLDVVLDVPPGRVQLLGHEGQYNYLGGRLAPRYMDNFAMLVQDMTSLAEGAVLNRGAESLRDDLTVTFHYPTRHAFEEETVWLLWRRDEAPSREERSANE